MYCHDAFESMSAALDGELDGHGREALRAHLAGCGACRGRQEELRALDGLVRPAARAARRGAPAALRGRIELALAAAPRPRGRVRVGLSLLAAAAVGAIAVLLVGRGRGLDEWHGEDVGLVGPAAALEVEQEDGRAEVRATGAGLRPGERVRAGDRAVELRLSGARVTLAARAVLALEAAPSLGRLERGRAIFDVPPGQGRARLETPAGAVVVLGTRFEVQVEGEPGGAAPPRATVTVRRGRVQLETDAGAAIVAAGETGLLVPGQAPARRPEGQGPALAAERPPEARDELAARALDAPAGGPAASGAIAAAAPSPRPGPDPGGEGGARAVALAGGAPPSLPPGGAIRGVVEVDGELGAAPGAAAPGCDARDGIGPGGGLGGAVVRLTSPEVTGSHWPIPPPVTIAISSCGMRPAVGAVAVGQLVQIESGSPELHALVATNRGRTLFEQALPGGMPPVTRRIATLGLVELSCRLHEGERAHLVASPHPFAAVTDATGAFLITGVPPGRHTLTGWHPRAGERGVAVDVAAGAVTEVRLALPGGAPARTEPPVAAAAPEPPAGQSEPVSAEPAPEARPALPPALRAAAQTNGCRFAITADTPVSRACAEGGVKRAKLVMKAIVKQARARAGAALDCDTCHTSEVTFALAVDARGRLEALLRVVETR